MAAALVIGLVIGGAGVWRARQPAPQAVTRVTIPADGLRVSTNVGSLGLIVMDSPVTLSPDGRTLVYLSVLEGPQLYRRPLDQLEAVPIRGTEGACCPFFSPDGEWVGFWSATGQGLQKVPAAGGPPVPVAPVTCHRQFTWGPDDTIVYGGFGTEAGLWVVDAAGGTPRRIATPDRDAGEQLYRTPTFLPDGGAVLFDITYDTEQSDQVAVRSLETGTQKVLVEGTMPRVTSAGHLVFFRDGWLWAVPFDAGRLRLDGEPVRILQGVRATTSGLAHYALGGDGSLVYGAGLVSTAPLRSLVWVNRNGVEEPVGTIPQPDRFIYPRISPDGTRVAVGISDTSGSTDLWALGIERESRTQVTFGGENQFFPIWTPDSARLTFADSANPANRVRWAPVGGDGETTTLLDRGARQFPTSWAADGRALAFYEDNTDTGSGRDIWILPVDEGGMPGTPVEFLATPFQERGAVFSPDGRWLAYVSDKVRARRGLREAVSPCALTRSTRSRQGEGGNRSGRPMGASCSSATGNRCSWCAWRRSPRSPAGPRTSCLRAAMF